MSGPDRSGPPEFLVIGAAKSGTTAIHHWLSRHPELQLPKVKETNFFAFAGDRPQFHGPGDEAALTRSDLVSSISSEDDYRRLFEPWDERRLRGEVCPLYLYSPRAADNIAKLAPSTRLIVVLRDPSERAFSQYLMLRESGREPLHEFAEGLADENRRIAAGWEHAWHYRSMGDYATQLRRYLDRFPRHSLRVYLFEDLASGASQMLRDLFGFLGVDAIDVGDTGRRHNRSGSPRNPLVDRVLRRPSRLKSALRPLVPRSVRRRLGAAVREINLVRPALPPEVRAELIGGYREGILELQELIDRDLSGWLEP